MKKTLSLLLSFIIASNCFADQISLPTKSPEPTDIFQVYDVDNDSYGVSYTNLAASITASNGILSSNAWTDPITDYHCAGVTTTTTGSISASSTSLTVASASGWEVGMGIAIANAGSGGTTEHITTVTAINGTTFTLDDAALSTVSSQTVNHDDTDCLTNAFRSGKNLHLRKGDYNVTSALIPNTNSTDMQFVGDGWESIIHNRGTTNDVISITDGVATRITFKDFYIQQEGVPTAGAGIKIGNNTTFISFFYMDNVRIKQTYVGLSIVGKVSNSIFQNSFIESYGGATSYGIYIDNDIPAGNLWFKNDQVAVLGSGGIALYITSADENSFVGMSIVRGINNIKIDDSNGTVVRQRFTDCALAQVDFYDTARSDPMIYITGTNIKNISFMNTEVGNGSGTNNTAVQLSGTWQGGMFVNTLIANVYNGFIVENGGYNSIINPYFDTVGNIAINLSSTGQPNNNTIIAPQYFGTIGQQLVDLTGKANNHIIGYHGNVGIGTARPSRSLLEVWGNAYYHDNVGIGTWVPAKSLDVNGEIRVKGNTDPDNASAAFFWNQNNVGPTISGANFEVRTGNAGAQASRIFAALGGNVGIGSTTPGVKLDVQGTIRSSSGTAGQSACWKADKSLGQCTSVVGAGGGCTCS